MKSSVLIIFILSFMFNNNFISMFKTTSSVPIVVTTWAFTDATTQAWKTILNNSALDAIEEGCSICEQQQCDGSVGFGGSPDENGETTLDSMIMDGNTMNIGAVVDLRRVMNAVSVARMVLEKTAHSILAGDQATQFAVNMGFKEEDLTTNKSQGIWNQWKNTNCQPNFWENVIPDPKTSCGPYKLDDSMPQPVRLRNIDDIGSGNHDTISMVAVDSNGNIASGTSTNGATHKIPGRVSDAAIPGSGSYADSKVGAAGCTGDGDVMLRFVPSFVAVEEMRRGSSPKAAARVAMLRIAEYYPSFSGAIVAVNKKGDFGAACHGMKIFPFSVANQKYNGTKVYYENCINSY